MRPTVSCLALLIVGVLLHVSVALGQPAPDPTDLDADGMPGVANPPAGAPQGPEVYAIQSTAKLLVEQSHDQNASVRGFTDFLLSQGWTVDFNLTLPVTDGLLGPYDVLLIPTRTDNLSIESYSSQEQAAVQSFLENGGGLWVLHDRNTAATGVNSLSAPYGVEFEVDLVIDSTNNEGFPFWPTIYSLVSHPIAQGVTSYGYFAGCCLTVSAPATIFGRGDGDSYSSACLALPPTLAVYESGSGRIVLSGDATPLHPSYYPERLRPEEERLLQNIANWLAGKTPTGTDNTSWGRLKSLYQ